MQARAFVPFGYVGQPVRGLESKIFVKLHVSVLMKIGCGIAAVFRRRSVHPDTMAAKKGL